jgi:hypothetical protein
MQNCQDRYHKFVDTKESFQGLHIRREDCSPLCKQSNGTVRPQLSVLDDGVNAVLIRRTILK